MERNQALFGFAWAIVRAIGGPIVEMAVSWLSWSILLAVPTYYIITRDVIIILVISSFVTVSERTYFESNAWLKDNKVHFKLLFSKYIICFEIIIFIIYSIGLDHTPHQTPIFDILLIVPLIIGWFEVLLIMGTFRRIICLLSGGVGCGLILFSVLAALTVAVIVGALCGVILGLLMGLTGALPHSQVVGFGYRTASGAAVLLAGGTAWGVVWGILVCATSGPPRAGENYCATKRLEAILTTLCEGPGAEPCETFHNARVDPLDEEKGSRSS